MKSIAELKAIREKAKLDAEVRKEKDGYKVVVGMATCGIAAGARPVMEALMNEVASRNLLNVTVTQAGCIGICQLEPVVEVFNPNGDKTTYVKMDEQRMKKVVQTHLVNGNVVQEFTIANAENE